MDANDPFATMFGDEKTTDPFSDNLHIGAATNKPQASLFDENDILNLNIGDEKVGATPPQMIDSTLIQMSNNDTKQSEEQMNKVLEGRNLANECLSSRPRQKTYFQRYIFDTSKYQCYFNTSTNEFTVKLMDGLWPFLPDNQPKELKDEYERLKQRMNGKPSQ